MSEKGIRVLLLLFMFAMLCGTGSGCGRGDGGGDESDKVLYLSIGNRINTLDPALAADFISQYMVAAFYDTLLQYNYSERPYRLEPSMLAGMPEVSDDLMRYKLTLRDDLFFSDDPCFKGVDKASRRVVASDVAYSIMRLADARLHSPVYWLFRGRIRGLDEFRRRTAAAGRHDMSMYDRGCEGLEIIDERTLVIHLARPDPRLHYSLAVPAAGIVSRRAVEFYGEDFSSRPVGSGPFLMGKYLPDHSITLERNPEYRFETWPRAELPADRDRALPLSDRIVCYLLRQPLAGWLMFLQGELDISSLDKDNFDAVIGEDLQLVKSLVGRGIRMESSPEFEVRYVGFNFADPLLADNLYLRKALSLAYNVGARARHFNYQMIPAEGVIPPGVPGHDPDYRNPYSRHDLEKAREYLRLAGYPGGIDPATGRPLELTFDQGGTAPQHRQLAELMVEDMKLIGIVIKPILNNRPVFLEKLRNGQFQLFRFSWVGDYPDAENFLQLFYGPNAGSCNRVFYRDAEFDRMFEAIVTMPDSPERTARYEAMSRYINERCAWIFEGHPIAFQLLHCWIRNYIPHDFAFSRWKYLAVDPELRAATKKKFRPLEMRELRR